MNPTALEHVVELNENAKALRRYAFAVSLSALGAIVRSSRAGSELRGFNEVAMQMRRWSRDLEQAAQQIYGHTAQSVRLVSDFVRKTRLAALLARAGEGQSESAPINVRARREQAAVGEANAALDDVEAVLRDTLEGVAQLALMASVLSRAALIEAATGSDLQRTELSIISREFATYAESVDAAISAVRTRNGGNNR